MPPQGHFGDKLLLAHILAHTHQWNTSCAPRLTHPKTHPPVEPLALPTLPTPTYGTPHTVSSRFTHTHLWNISSALEASTSRLQPLSCSSPNAAFGALGAKLLRTPLDTPTYGT